MTRKLADYPTDPAAFIDDFVKVNELGRPFALTLDQREVLKLAFAFDKDGRLPWDTIIWACPKKSGKTTINGALTTWWGFSQEAPNEVYILANDIEQSLGRVYKTAAGIIQKNEALEQSVDIQARRMFINNGTEIASIASEYAGAAGSNHGFLSYDELWAFTSESLMRLWEELTPVPTRRNSIRFITTYAGWENESTLLWNLYKLGVDKEEHPEGQGEKIHPTLPIYANREARLFIYWDHEPRMPWQTPEYYASQKRVLRPAIYLRLHENRWTTAESTFIVPELWDPCVSSELRPLIRSTESIFVGVDAGIKHDSSAVVAVRWEGDQLALTCHHIWKPTPNEPLDLEATIEAYLENLHAMFSVEEILCDPYQLHRSITTLKAKDLPIREFPQTVPNTTAMGQALFDLLTSKNILLYPSEEVRAQALNTISIETPRGWRIAKEKTTKKIDVIVALAMACVSAMTIGKREPVRIL